MAEPRILRVQAKDIHIVMEIPLDWIKKMVDIIEMSEFKYDSSKSEEVELLNFLNDQLHPFLKGTVQGVEEQIR
ncbi:MAG: hypothetical protein DRP58_02780 [Spirochaetes bacterium]|nr:MAG: hypothetical protein DRP58_02780 [Spirochaetota bacterium]